MKRDLTLKLNKVVLDYKTKPNKQLEKRIGLDLKLLGDIKIGKGLEMYFEDGYVHKTSALEIEGFINNFDKDNNLVMITICTKEICYELLVSDNKKFNIKTEEQLSLF